MKKAMSALIALLALAGVGTANASIFGIDVGAGFYQPRDGRFTGVGVDAAINARMSNDLLVGYRVEELQVQGSDTPTLAAGNPGATVKINSQATFQGIQAYYTAARAMEDKLSADVGLWVGNVNSNNFPTAPGAGAGANGTASQGVSSFFVEPQARVSYTAKGPVVDAKFYVGAGYRWVRGISINIPFFDGGGANTAVAAGGNSRSLKNFDGLDLSVGFGLLF